jgi:hypothetical protein
MQMHICSAAGGRVPTVCKAEAVCLPLSIFACVYTFRGGMWSRAYICVYSSFLAGWAYYWRYS